eukprot:TRINITY_DN49380_c0_g1_i1.p1 TRINITY_DN49380_c0_g1~~TRINITY_DN49380_c0_g1_i1.p1  ORF type:complete len:180 (+),score=9.84 TRINITY_DN49380_c0_g1_i1:107-646(+)
MMLTQLGMGLNHTWSTSFHERPEDPLFKIICMLLTFVQSQGCQHRVSSAYAQWQTCLKGDRLGRFQEITPRDDGMCTNPEKPKSGPDERHAKWICPVPACGASRTGPHADVIQSGTEHDWNAHCITTITTPAATPIPQIRIPEDLCFVPLHNGETFWLQLHPKSVLERSFGVCGGGREF